MAGFYGGLYDCAGVFGEFGGVSGGVDDLGWVTDCGGIIEVVQDDAR